MRLKYIFNEFFGMFTGVLVRRVAARIQAGGSLFPLRDRREGEG